MHKLTLIIPLLDIGCKKFLFYNQTIQKVLESLAQASLNKEEKAKNEISGPIKQTNGL